ncbi:Acidic mammalian chitinase [Lamellibrachia satsuma]|nr:Acidic mammalian chitinase [Lamellibrachia satsuma]
MSRFVVARVDGCAVGASLTRSHTDNDLSALRLLLRCLWSLQPTDNMKVNAISSLVVVAMFVILRTTSAVGMKRICYFVNWAQYRPGFAKHNYTHIDPSLCSHLIIAFAGMDGNKLEAIEWNDEDTPTRTGVYSHVVALKRKQPELKVMLAVGGWNFGVEKMSAMLETEKHRKEFANNVVTFLRQRDFDGFDLDFEYPARRGSPPEDKERFALLCKELRERFELDAKQRSKPRLLLSAAVGCGKSTMEAAYDIPELVKYVDWVGLMSYDLEFSQNDITKHQSPLFPRDDEPAADKELSIEWIVDYWMSQGAPANKLVVGMAFYGKTFTLTSAAHHDVGDPKSGVGKQGPFTKLPGFLAFYEVCGYVSNGWTRQWIESQKVPFAYKDTQWVGYDDDESMREKAKWTTMKELGGWMVWDLAMDDFGGHFCNKGNYPMLKALNEHTTSDGDGHLESTTLSRVVITKSPTMRPGGSKTDGDKPLKSTVRSPPKEDDEDDDDDEDYEDYEDYDDDNEGEKKHNKAATVEPAIHLAACLVVGVTSAVFSSSL